MIGQVLGHCRVQAKIGEGGMGVVYRAYDEVLQRDVVIKVVKKTLASAPPGVRIRKPSSGAAFRLAVPWSALMIEESFIAI